MSDALTDIARDQRRGELSRRMVEAMASFLAEPSGELVEEVLLWIGRYGDFTSRGYFSGAPNDRWLRSLREPFEQFRKDPESFPPNGFEILFSLIDESSYAEKLMRGFEKGPFVVSPMTRAELMVLRIAKDWHRAQLGHDPKVRRQFAAEISALELRLRKFIEKERTPDTGGESDYAAGYQECLNDLEAIMDGMEV